MATFEVSTASLYLLLSFILYRCAIILNRLYFHPLSAFPGPKLTAATYLVELYYDLFEGEGGQLFRAHRDWHRKYGPIVRINPDELHIQDSSYWETMYAPSRPVRRVPGFGIRLCHPPVGAGVTEDPVLYRARRSTLDRFFSKRRIGDFGVEVQARCNTLLRRVEKEYVEEGTGRVLNLSHMWECYAADLAVHVVFGQEHGTISSPDFHSPINRAWEDIMETEKFFAHFPFAFYLTTILPKWIVTWLMPHMKLIIGWSQVCVVLDKSCECLTDGRQDMAIPVADAAAAHANGKGDESTLVGSLFHQRLPPEEAAVPRVLMEAGLVVGAGVETVVRTLALANYHIISQPHIRDRLVAELTAAIPDASVMPDWNTLASLPYLSACIEEALRLTYGLFFVHALALFTDRVAGVVERRTRAYDSGNLMYGDWKIPSGTFVSMTTYDVACDEAIFPDPFSFRPDRWLGDPRAPDGRALSRYMVSFGKGMRGCVGVHLAYLELYVGIATFFRSPLGVKARLYQTDKSDVEMARDAFVPRPVKHSKGVRAVFQ